jgi:aspartyl-tRNA(Asn)/glutamyl-tRNA(Gln) amidotransferase subunit A
MPELSFISGTSDLFSTAAAIAAGEISPVELAEDSLRAIAQLDPKLNAYITVLADQAMAAAREAEREISAGTYRGPLHGIPVSVKDLFWTKGIRTTSGSRVLTDFVPDENAAIVDRLAAAGSTLLGKTNMLEFAYASVHPDFGPTKNPWDLTKTTSGSSGGAAASTAAGIDYGSFGTDTGGSVRIPASFCGVCGLKPSYGLISRVGVQALSWTLDHVGPFARTVRDLALLLEVVAGHDSRDRQSADRGVLVYQRHLTERLDGVRIGVVTNFMDSTVDPEVLAAVTRAVELLRDAGATIEEHAIPELEGDALTAEMGILLPEASYCHRDLFDLHQADYSETVLERLQAGRSVPAVTYIEALEARDRLRGIVRNYQADLDLLVMPTTPMVATPLESTTLEVGEGEEDLGALIRMTAPFDVTGQPALSVPCGFTSSGLPIGLQLVGRDFEDGTVLRAGHAYQLRAEWHRRRPTTSASWPHRG